MNRDVNLQVDQLCQGLGKIEARFVRDMITGISESQSMRLSRIGEALNESIPLHATHKRLSRNLADHNIANSLSDRLLELNAKTAKKHTRIVLDQFDIKKKYATKMQYIDNLDNEQESNVKGYRACEILSSDIETRTYRPLAQSLWSHNAPDFEGDHVEVLNLVEKARRATHGKGILVVNAGLSNNAALLNPWTIDETCRYIVRLYGNYSLVHKNRTYSADQLADECETPYGTTIYNYVDSREYQYFIHYGFVPVRLQAAPERPLWLVVVKGSGAPYMLLTTEPMRRNRKLLLGIVEAYLTRWQIVYTNHFSRRQVEFDDLRVLSYERVRNLATLMQATIHSQNSEKGVPILEVGLSFERKLHHPPVVPKIEGYPIGPLFSLTGMG
ncbi:MAG TPA: hypothetical protein EYG51_04000 [Pseudomonadales bacterium]|nr:hypothetical protein [Pseudomonadales bacterium]